MSTKKILLLVSICVIIAFGAFYGFQTKKTNSPSNTTVSNDYRDMGDPELGFTFKLPDAFTVEKNGQFSRLYFKKTNDKGVGAINFIYVSVVPAGKNLTPGEIYNYNTEDLEVLNMLQVGETKTLGNISDTNLSIYYNYTRIDDAMIGGYGSKGYINKKPWEFPSGTTEYRYIIPFEQATFIVGGYVGEDTSSPYYLSDSEFIGLLKNLKITPDTIKSLFTSPVPQGAWIKFTDPGMGISFTYPSEWTKRTDGQNFQEGDLFTLIAIGQTQRTQTELYDGVSFAVMKPVSSDGDIGTWVQKRYGKISESGEEVQYSKVSFGGNAYEKIVTCGLGCFTYYHSIQNGKVFGFVVNAVGPHAASYTQTIEKIMSGIVYD